MPIESKHLEIHARDQLFSAIVTVCSCGKRERGKKTCHFDSLVNTTLSLQNRHITLYVANQSLLNLPRAQSASSDDREGVKVTWYIPRVSLTQGCQEAAVSAPFCVSHNQHCLCSATVWLPLKPTLFVLLNTVAEANTINYVTNYISRSSAFQWKGNVKNNAGEM